MTTGEQAACCPPYEKCLTALSMRLSRHKWLKGRMDSAVRHFAAGTLVHLKLFLSESPCPRRLCGEKRIYDASLVPLQQCDYAAQRMFGGRLAHRFAAAGEPLGFRYRDVR
jgi:hypothetical protein